MPACLSNLTLPTIDQPADPQACPDVTEGEVHSVADAVAGVSDPRKPRGVRHSGFGLLMGVLVAVLAGAHAARLAATTAGLRHFAVDGKSLRGAARTGCITPHLPGVLDVGAALFLTQRQIDRETNEIGMFAQAAARVRPARRPGLRPHPRDLRPARRRLPARPAGVGR